jgi:hypothetical protein
MQTLIITLTILALGAWGLGWLKRNYPGLATRPSRVAMGVALVLLGIVAGAKGQVWLSGPAVSVGIWLLWSTSSEGGGWWPRSSGKRSAPVERITTDHLEIERDPVTGAMRGRVLKGFFKGRTLQRMQPVELAHLWQDCRLTDPASAQLVEPFLDRAHPTWREDMARDEAGLGHNGAMPSDEALEILGLEPGASTDDIRRAHRELMLKLHPDRGGSTYLAAKINAAKEALLGRNG